MNCIYGMITPTGKLIITCKLLQQAAGELHAANMLVFYTFEGSWVISFSQPLGKCY